MNKYLVILIGLILLVGCASSSKVQTDNGKSASKLPGKYDESFDPTTLDDDDIEIGREANDTGISQSAEKPDKAVETEKVLMNEVEGYRVQILATKSIETATLQQQKAIDRFSAYNYKIYLIYEAPFYRLRMGDAANLKDAEIIRDLAKDQGYDEAFPVRSKVVVPESSN
jgi:hypothetical protein